ncbi:unnamed protein product [Candidula unifasciata]|uniref:Alpha-mannosidase n=1 Tax=Candidula unifasciata TaxID=100452 RepID=A0A8S3ZCY4_9EUPU|nr:unnamed protein product [Candidula unifasciata]
MWLFANMKFWYRLVSLLLMAVVSVGILISLSFNIHRSQLERQHSLMPRSRDRRADFKVHVKRLLRRGQLEITLGGWVMPDEASSHYISVIDQLIEGHQWLWENLGVRPENSWSIDPFGHSSTMPYLWKRSGMTNMASLIKEKALEFNWRQMWDMTGSTDIFCHVMPYMLYNIKYTCGPNTFSCLHFDFRAIHGETSESLATEVTDGNVESSAEMLYRQYRAKANYFRYNTILVPIGDDFRYDREVEWDQQYNNYQKLIQFMNSKPEWNIHVQWGTLKHYFQNVEDERNKRKFLDKNDDPPVLSGDFFPYSDKDMAYWTGYFSTRPFDKYLSRELQSILQAADILNTLYYAVSKRKNGKSEVHFSTQASLLQQARRALGLFLHHDAITGTSKSFVVEDYEQNLFRALENVRDVMKFLIQSLLSDGQVESPVVFQPETARKHYQGLPQKQLISVAESGTTVAFFNSLAHPRQQVVHLLVDTHHVVVMSSTAEVISIEISPEWSKGQESVIIENIFELSFIADISPFAITSYTLYRRTPPPLSVHLKSIEVINSPRGKVHSSVHFPASSLRVKKTDPIKIDNQVIQLTFDPNTGSLFEVKDMVTGREHQLNISFQVYQSRGSGAYLFSPKEAATPLFSNIPTMTISRGSLTTTVVVDFGQQVVHTVTLYHKPSQLAAAIFIENLVNIDQLKDKEVVMRLDTDIDNHDLSYFTDQNAFQFIRRRTNKDLPIEANYYPITSGVVLEDPTSRLTLLTAQPHGVACLAIGQVELMLDRQLVMDDKRGLGEGVTDIKPTISRFVIMMEQITLSESSTTSSSYHTSLSLASLGVSDMLQQPLLSFFTNVNTTIFSRTVSLLSSPVPCDLSIISFRSLTTGSLDYNGTSLMLHRRGYDCSFPSNNHLCSLAEYPLTFGTLLTKFNLSNIYETSLTLTSNKRPVSPTDKISIAPMEIATFHFHF